MDGIDRLHAWGTAQPVLRVFAMIVRVLLALAFVPSGLVKIVGEPFTTLPVSDPVGKFFAGFFSADVYYRFVGIAQWMAGGLLLIPHFATIGALMYFPIIVNIFAITVAIGPPFAGTRFVTGALLAGNVYLLFWDWDRWKHILPTAAQAKARHADVLTTVGMLIAAGVVFHGLTTAHLARLRHQDLVTPLAFAGIGALVGGILVVVAYRRASR